jgi:hypothetical protein
VYYVVNTTQKEKLFSPPLTCEGSGWYFIVDGSSPRGARNFACAFVPAITCTRYVNGRLHIRSSKGCFAGKRSRLAVSLHIYFQLCRLLQLEQYMFVLSSRTTVSKSVVFFLCCSLCLFYEGGMRIALVGDPQIEGTSRVERMGWIGASVSYY